MFLRVFAATLVFVSACATVDEGQFILVDDLPPADMQLGPYRLQAGDQVSLLVWNQPTLSGTALVMPDGHITVPLRGTAKVAGLTPSQAGDLIAGQLEGILTEPRVSVTITQPLKPTVTVLGEVRTIGQYPLEGEEGVLEVLARAGGLNEFADPDAVFVMRAKPRFIRIKFNYDHLLRGIGLGTQFRLAPGDIIVVE